MIRDHRNLGPAQTDVMVHEAPLSEDGGEIERHEIWIIVAGHPILGVRGYSWRDPGPGLVCGRVATCG
jgi:hypothetical protein